MTLPRLAVDSPYGRLYRHPTTPMEKIADRTEAYQNGLIVPSVTNIIDVLNKPFLMDWYARLSAQAAVDVSFEHPGLIQQKPDKAKKWISEAAIRYTKQAADLGTRVHDVVEKLSRGETGLYYDADVQPFVNSWHDFVDTFQPEFLYMEATCYGAVPNNRNSNTQSKLGYAGTTDFICRINNKLYAADYKTGRSIHTEAALQLAALVNSYEIVLDDDQTIEMPKIDGGIVVHLTAKGFSVYPTDPFNEAWETFIDLRQIWDFHVRNLASRQPLFIGNKWKKLSDAE